VLFELEGSGRDPEDALLYQIEDSAAPADVAAFARELVVGALENREAIDRAIAEASSNWRLEDIGKVERAALRLGAYELLFAEDRPVGVAIDEAIELTRLFAGDEAARFVNGVLGRVAGEPV
jgi:N utilization substance protein B